jgi:hypothetical protein
MTIAQGTQGGRGASGLLTWREVGETNERGKEPKQWDGMERSRRRREKEENR